MPRQPRNIAILFLLLIVPALATPVAYAQEDRRGLEAMAGKSSAAPTGACMDYPSDISRKQTLFIDPNTISVVEGGAKLCGNWSASSTAACGSANATYSVPRRGWSSMRQKTCADGKEYWEVDFGADKKKPTASNHCRWKGDDYSSGSVRDCTCSKYWPSGSCSEELCYVCANGSWKEHRKHIPLP